jgi:hypothetical protein
MVYSWTHTVTGAKAANQIWYIPNAYKRLVVSGENSVAGDNQNVIVREFLRNQELSETVVPMTNDGAILFDGVPKGTHLTLTLVVGISADPASVLFQFWGED